MLEEILTTQELKGIMDDELEKVNEIIKNFLEKYINNKNLEEELRLVVSFLMNIHIKSLNTIEFICNTYGLEFTNLNNGKNIMKEYVCGVNKLMEELVYVVSKGSLH